MLQIVIKVVSSKPAVVLSDATSLTVFMLCLPHWLTCLSNPVGGYCNVLDPTQVSLRVKVFPGLCTLQLLQPLSQHRLPVSCKSSQPILLAQNVIPIFATVNKHQRPHQRTKLQTFVQLLFEIVVYSIENIGLCGENG